jgi:hypothetical protein
LDATREKDEDGKENTMESGHAGAADRLSAGNIEKKGDESKRTGFLPQRQEDAKNHKGFV